MGGVKESERQGIVDSVAGIFPSPLFTRDSSLLTAVAVALLRYYSVALLTLCCTAAFSLLSLSKDAFAFTTMGSMNSAIYQCKIN